MCRTVAHVLDMSCTLKLFSLHDGREKIRPWIERSRFRGFSGNRQRFVCQSILKGFAVNTLVISHINLALPAYLLKILRPRLRVIVIAHGVEIWEKPVSGWGKKLLQKAEVISVSNYTSARLQALFGVSGRVINNCLSPFLVPSTMGDFRDRLGIDTRDKVVLTLSRLAATEQKKGYDRVLSAVGKLKKEGMMVKYVFAGKYEDAEKERLEGLARHLECADSLFFTGFIHDKDLASLFQTADVYIMPSTKEGFGITFIEAMYYGVPVIAGNADGSVDALVNGQLGVLIDPDDDTAILDALRMVLKNRTAYQPDQQLLESRFGFDRFRRQWRSLLA